MARSHSDGSPEDDIVNRGAGRTDELVVALAVGDGRFQQDRAELAVRACRHPIKLHRDSGEGLLLGIAAPPRTTAGVVRLRKKLLPTSEK